MACKINKGFSGGTDLAGVKFWVAGDLSDIWKDGDTKGRLSLFRLAPSMGRRLESLTP